MSIKNPSIYQLLLEEKSELVEKISHQQITIAEFIKGIEDLNFKMLEEVNKNK